MYSPGQALEVITSPQESMDDSQEFDWQAVKPFSKEDFLEDYYPLHRCPPHLLASETVFPAQIPVQLFYGLIVPAETFVSYANANLHPTGTTKPASNSKWHPAMDDVTRHFGIKFRRLLTCCVVTMEGLRAGVIGLFTNRTAPWFSSTAEEDRGMLQTLKDELGLPEQVEGAWFYSEADYDFQELIPSSYLKKIMAKRTRRLQKLDAERKKALKRAGSSDTLRGDAGLGRM